jgi:hypothetical protein
VTLLAYVTVRGYLKIQRSVGTRHCHVAMTAEIDAERVPEGSSVFLFHASVHLPFGSTGGEDATATM